MRLLDLYILKSFLVPFLYCFFGFLGIWFVFDLSTTAPDFISARVSIVDVLRFYGTQVPQFIVISLPVGVLLALLYSMSQLSRRNEIISMLTAGIGVGRILVPLFGAGFLLSLVSFGFNYKLAPHAEAQRESLREQLITKEEESDVLEAHLFVNRGENRIWFVRRLDLLDKSRLQNVQVSINDSEGRIDRKLFARNAIYQPENGNWLFDWPKFVEFDGEGNVLREFYTRQTWVDGTRFIDTDEEGEPLREWDAAEWFPAGLDETPWRIASARMTAKHMSVPELREYLRHNSDFSRVELAPFRTHLMGRLALPWACLVVVFIAAPLGIVYSRRGLLAGVASAIFIFFGMVFLTKLFLALGEGARIPPFFAGWSPNLVFLSIGLYLLYLRSTNRDLPNLLNLVRFKAK